MAFQVRDAMTATVVTVFDDQPIEEVCALLLRHHVSGLPVVDRQGTLVGVVSELDVLKLFYHLQPEKGLARDCMSPSVVTIREDDSLMDACYLFIHQNIRRLPVVRDGQLVGVLSRRDLVRYIREMRRSLGRDSQAPLTFATQQEVADYCHVNVKTVQRKLKSGELPRRQENGKYVFTWAELQTLLA